MDENKVIEMYQSGKYTLSSLANELSTNHHMIKRILLKHGVKITRCNMLRVFSEEHKQKISKACKGRKIWSEGKKMSDDHKRKNMIAHMKLGITLDDINKYPDFDKLKFLTGGISRNIRYFTKEKYLSYIDKFYNDNQFDRIYNSWIQNGKSKWYLPTLDHKVSRHNGGEWDLPNLQFLTWFENRAKAEMDQDEWDKFKTKTNTDSDLFT